MKKESIQTRKRKPKMPKTKASSGKSGEKNFKTDLKKNISVRKWN